ncbi:ATP-binding protein, partial [Roseicyclus sp.]|uniref:ATP-binding protein n=1 Tax=Roseicyclus sp. TaxID=1914329 RepID=UPI003F9EC86F
ALRSEELYSANRKLAEHAEALSFQVIEQREENAALMGRATRVVAELAVATGRAEIAEQRLWDALTAVEDGFAVFDRDCRLVAANPAYLALFEGVSDVAPGASYEAILRIAADEGIVDLEGAHPDDWIERMLARWEGEVIPRTDLRLWNGSFVRLIDKRTPQGDTVCLGIDLTSTLRREQELRQARDAALAASRAKSAFLANMSHEFRTPMNGIVSMAELLGETALDAEQQLFAETIRHSGEALLELIKDLLDYSKIEAGRLVLHEEAFDLLSLILEVFGLLRPRLEGRDLRFRLDLDMDGTGTLIGDCGRMRQILFNLIGNAVKFTDTGHVLVRVQAVVGTEGEVALLVAVEDTGIGIPEELQAHVFGEFNQVEDQANRSHDGTGLGLTITRRLLSLMGGEIGLESEPGRGSTFSFGVTLRQDATGAPAARLRPERREVRLIGPLFSGRVRELVAMLARAGAHIRADTRPDAADPPGTEEIVVLLGRAEAAAGMAGTLREAGLTGPILHFGDGQEDAPPCLVSFELPEAADDLPALLERLLAADAAPAAPAELPRMSILAAE